MAPAPGMLEFSRRQFMPSALGLAGLLTNLSTAAATQSPTKAKAKSVILIFNCGGPSHIDLWDPKPDAADNIRGEFSTISTKVPGIFVSDVIPDLAARMDKLAIVRSLYHTQASHNAGMYYSITGYPYRQDSTLINPSATDYPSVGTLVGWLAQRDGYSGSLPPYVITPYPHCDSLQYITPGQYGGCLGVKHDPLVLDADPNAADFRVRNLALEGDLNSTRIDDRLSLLSGLGGNKSLQQVISSDYELRRKQAADMILSGKAAKAFDLSHESPATRDRYGRHTWGQSHLLARRLVEAGVPFVTTVNGRSIVWDTHKDNFAGLKNRLVPPMQQAFVALLDDLSSSGLLDTTLVVWMGDFGRTPMINKDGGRDHWPQCASVVLAGGGVRGGQVIGSSDNKGAYPYSVPATPGDLHATIFKALGYDPRGIHYPTVDGRPTPLANGSPIPNVLS